MGCTRRVGPPTLTLDYLTLAPGEAVFLRHPRARCCVLAGAGILPTVLWSSLSSITGKFSPHGLGPAVHGSEDLQIRTAERELSPFTFIFPRFYRLCRSLLLRFRNLLLIPDSHLFNFRQAHRICVWGTSALVLCPSFLSSIVSRLDADRSRE